MNVLAPLLDGKSHARRAAVDTSAVLRVRKQLLSRIAWPPAMWRAFLVAKALKIYLYYFASALLIV
jgi:hypothetical protein